MKEEKDMTLIFTKAMEAFKKDAEQQRTAIHQNMNTKPLARKSK